MIDVVCRMSEIRKKLESYGKAHRWLRGNSAFGNQLIQDRLAAPDFEPSTRHRQAGTLEVVVGKLPDDACRGKVLVDGLSRDGVPAKGVERRILLPEASSSFNWARASPGLGWQGRD